MSKKAPRKPAAFRIEEVEVFTPPSPPAVAEPESLPVARARTLPDLGRGLRLCSRLRLQPELDMHREKERNLERRASGAAVFLPGTMHRVWIDDAQLGENLHFAVAREQQWKF